MTGPRKAVDLEAAQQLLVERVKALGTEEVRLPDALGRVLAQDVPSGLDVPPFARAAVDGFALRAEDTFGAGALDPVELRITGEAFPGKLPTRPLERGEVVRIMTGAPVPEGADAVVMLEHSEETDGMVRLVAPLPPGRNVASRGEDVKAGEVVVARGRRLRAEDVGLLASIGERSARVHLRPRVVVFSSGNEVQDPLAGEPARPGAIFDANGYVLVAQALEEGALATRGGILRDDRAAIRAALDEVDAHVTITSGAASRGKEDYMPGLVRELGELWVEGVSIRPAHPTGFGRIGARLHFMLPGNPVAAWVGFRAFVRPALRLLSGLPAREAFRPARTTRAPLSRKIVSVVGRTDFVRVRLLEDGRVEPLRTGGASMLTTVTKADGLVIVARELEGLEEGALVEVELL